MSQFDKDDVEKVGLVKFDFLGLTTLTILAESERNIRALGQPDFDLQRIALDDPRRLQGVLLGQHGRRSSSSNRAACATSS